MSEEKSSISQAASYQAIGEFWDNHDLGDFWAQTEPADFAVDLQTDILYYAVETTLAQRLRLLAKQRGVSAETLLNLWVLEKMQEEMAIPS